MSFWRRAKSVSTAAGLGEGGVYKMYYWFSGVTASGKQREVYSKTKQGALWDIKEDFKLTRGILVKQKNSGVEVERYKFKCDGKTVTLEKVK